MRRNIGDEIKAIRKEKNLTQKQLAANAGVSEITVRKYEAESIPLKTDTLQKLADGLEIPLSKLMGCDKELDMEISEYTNILIKLIDKIPKAQQLGFLELASFTLSSIAKSSDEIKDTLASNLFSILSSYGNMVSSGHNMFMTINGEKNAGQRTLEKSYTKCIEKLIDTKQLILEEYTKPQYDPLRNKDFKHPMEKMLENSTQSDTESDK